MKFSLTYESMEKSNLDIQITFLRAFANGSYDALPSTFCLLVSRWLDKYGPKHPKTLTFFFGRKIIIVQMASKLIFFVLRITWVVKTLSSHTCQEKDEQKLSKDSSTKASSICSKLNA